MGTGIAESALSAFFVAVRAGTGMGTQEEIDVVGCREGGVQLKSHQWCVLRTDSGFQAWCAHVRAPWGQRGRRTLSRSLEVNAARHEEACVESQEATCSASWAPCSWEGLGRLPVVASRQVVRGLGSASAFGARHKA